MKLIMGFLTFTFTIFLLSSQALAADYVMPNRPAVSPISGQSVRAQADMKEDIRQLQNQLKELSLRVELLESQKAQLQEQIASSRPDVSGFVTRQELQLLEQRVQDYAAAEDQKTRESILSEIRTIAKSAGVSSSGSRYPVNQPEAVRTASQRSSYEPVQPLIVSDAEKQRYMREGVRHVVRSGDTLSDIARRYRSSVRAIRAVNNIADPNRLFVGMELFVPTSIK